MTWEWEEIDFTQEHTCEKCGSTEWEGMLRCRHCYGYRSHGRCAQCGHPRLERCPSKRCPPELGELDYVSLDWRDDLEEKEEIKQVE